LQRLKTTQNAGLAFQRLHADTSGWAYSNWKPASCPKTVPTIKFLDHYATRLNSVAVNYTFRTLPSSAQLAGWLAAVGDDFRFSFKTPQTITHFKRLNDCDSAVTEFLASLAPVREAGKMGCLLFQLPPNFKCNVERLKAFLDLPTMQGAGQVAFEFRNASWFCEEVYSLLKDNDVAGCIAESDDPATPESLTATFSCYRQRMDGGYAAPAVTTFAKRFSKIAKTREIYVYFNHEDEPTGPLAAVQMLAEARAL